MCSSYCVSTSTERQDDGVVDLDERHESACTKTMLIDQLVTDVAPQLTPCISVNLNDPLPVPSVLHVAGV